MQGDDPHNNREMLQPTVWEQRTFVRFRHVETNRWLSSSPKLKFNNENCPQCPILGELEVSGTNHLEQASIFRAEDGVFLRV